MRRLVAILILCLSATVAMAAVDLNTATEVQLQALPGVGPAKAKAIVEDRQANGPFKTVEDLGRVKGIGDKTIAELRPLVSAVSDSASNTVPGNPASTSTAPTQSSAHLPWGLIALAAVAVVAVAWVVMRRRSTPVSASTTPASSDAEAVPDRKVTSSVPSAPHGTAAKATGPSTAPPAPAGMRPTQAPGVPSAASTETRPPAPAGAKPPGH